MNWRVYYGDGSTFSSGDGDPFHAPPSNVQVVSQDGKLQSGKDAYYWKPEFGWQACDQAGLADYLMMYVGPKAILYGRTIRDEAYWGVRQRAKKDLEKS